MSDLSSLRTLDLEVYSTTLTQGLENRLNTQQLCALDPIFEAAQEIPTLVRLRVNLVVNKGVIGGADCTPPPKLKRGGRERSSKFLLCI